MGTEAQTRRVRRSDQQVLKAFGIAQMQADMHKMAGTISEVANSQVNLRAELQKKHDDLVRQLAKEVAKIIADERALVEVRNRDLKGRLKWLLTGK